MKYITSDDSVALSYGMEMGVNPVVRPWAVSDDTASANDVVKHFITTLPTSLLKHDPYIVYLQPTSPLRTAKHIDDAMSEMKAKGFTALISVVEMTKSPFKSFIFDNDGCLQALFGEAMTNKRRQDLPSVYVANGAIYIFRVSNFNERAAFPSNGALPYVMTDRDSLDIDTKEDFALLERLIYDKHQE